MEQRPNDPDELDALKATLAAATAKAAAVEAELAMARAKNADDAATIASQKLEIAKLKRQIYGPRSERASRLTLCDLTGRVLKQGLEVLGIETVEQM